MLPTVDAVTLNPGTVVSGDSATQLALTIDIAESTAGVDGYSLYLIDSSGGLDSVEGGGVPTTFSGPFTQYFGLPENLAPGTYTVAFTLQDQNYKSVSYGMPGDSRPMPGGPVVLTVTGQ